MIIEKEMAVEADHAVVSAYLADVPQMSDCIPGITNLEPSTGDTYIATLQVDVGPIRTEFQGEVKLDRSKLPDRLEATAVGHDRRTRTQVRVEFSADIVQVREAYTTVMIHTDLSIRGKLAQYGTAVVASTAEIIFDHFQACVSQRLRDLSVGTEKGGQEVENRTETGAGGRPLGIRFFFAIAASLFHRTLSNLRRFIRRLMSKK